MHVRRAITAAATLAVSLLLAGPAAAAPTPSAPERITWGIAPATADGPDDRVSFRAEVAPGDTYEDHVAVINHSEHEVTFALTASDGVITEEGEFDLLTSERPTGTGAWIEHPDEVTVEGGETAVVPFAVTVPQDAVPGDHPGGLLASVLSAPGGGAAVGLDAGVGTRIHLRVAGQVRPSVAVTDLDASYTGSWHPLEPGVLDVRWTVRNDGNVRLGATQLLEVSGLLGLDPGVVAQQVGQQREVLPGQAVSLRASVEAWPFGLLTTQVSASTAVVGQDALDVALPATLATTTTTAVPWAQLVVLLLALGGVVALVVRRRRRRARVAAASSAVQEVAI